MKSSWKVVETCWKAENFVGDAEKPKNEAEKLLELIRYVKVS